MRFTGLLYPLILLAAVNSKANDEELFDLGLRQLMNITVEGATLTPETVSSAPAALTVFDASYIQSLPVDYLYELLNFVPGVQSQRGADSGFSFGYSFRGRRNGNQSKEILLLIDGHVLNDPRTGAANGSARMMNVAQIERVEVIRGPSSALYGSGAYSGVVNIITRQNSNSIQLQAGSFNHQAINLFNHYGKRKLQLDSFLYASNDDGDEYNLDDSFSDDVSDRINTTDPRKIIEWHGSIKYKRTHVSLIHNELEGNDYYSLENVSDAVNYNRFIHSGIQVEQSFKWNSTLDSRVEFQYAKTNQDLHSQVTAEGALNDPALSNPASSDPVIILAEVEAEGYRFNWHNNWRSNDRLSTQFGLNWIKNITLKSQAANNFDVLQLSANQFPIDYYGDFSNVTKAASQDPQIFFGAYGQALYQVNDAQQLNIGLRYDYTESDSGHWSPRLGWVSSIDDNNTFKMLFGQAFRAASLSEMSSPDSPILKGDPNLRHEVIETLDLIYMYQDSTLNLQTGVYYNHYDDPIIIILNPQSIRQYVNGSESESYGIELEMNYELVDDTWLRVALSEQLGRPDSFFRESKRTGSLVLTGLAGNIRWNITTLYSGSRKTEYSVGEFSDISSHWLWSSKIQFSHNEYMKSVLQLKNVNDQQFADSPQGEGLIEGVPNRGRALTYSFKYDFH